MPSHAWNCIDQGPVGTQATPLTGRMFAVLACGASTALWLWFTALKPNYILHLVVPALVLACGGGGLVFAEMYRQTQAMKMRRRYVPSVRNRYYTFAVLFCGVAMLSIFFHAPVYARFALSRPAMDAFIGDYLQDPGELRPATMRVGWYVIETEPRGRRDALLFHLPGDYETGFTYSPTPLAGYPGLNRGDGHSLGGGWYWFSDD